MTLKKELARSIVADFHSAEAATRAAEDWAKQFQKDQVPEEVETESLIFAELRIAKAMACGWQRFWSGLDLQHRPAKRIGRSKKARSAWTE